MEINPNNMDRSQAYEARGVIARYHEMGHYQEGAVQVPIYKFLTLDRGRGKKAVAIEYVRPAPVKTVDEEAVLDVESLREGEFVVMPGFVYKKCLWFDNLTAAHMKALQTYKPKDIVVADKADAPAIDMGTFDHTTDQVTKQ